MPRSQNGWPASPSKSAIDIRPLEVAGVNFAPGLAYHDYCAVVLGYVFEQYHYRVEKLRPGWCWGWYYRANRNDPTDLSNHSSGTAGDCNAPLHPNGRPVSVNFSAKQVAEIHKILDEVNGLGGGTVVRWGGDYTQTIDAMHFELVGTEVQVAQAGQVIEAGGGTKIPLPTKIVVGAKPKPSVKRVPGAVGADTVNVAAIFRGNAGAPNDIKQVQRVLNAWYYPHADSPGRLKVDGIYGDKTYNALDSARRAFKIGQPVSNRDARRKTLRKLGFKTTH